MTTGRKINLITKISKFSDTVHNSRKLMNPAIIANYSHELSQLFNEFYHLHPILKEVADVRDARLVLTKAVQQTIKNSLNLLGIDVLEKM